MGRGTVAPQNIFLDHVVRSCNQRGTNFLVCNARLTEFPIVYCSDTFVHLMGFKKSHILERGGLCQFLHGTLTEQVIIQEMRTALTECFDLQREVILYQQSGNPLWVLLRIMVIRDDEDAAVLLLLTFRDISDLKEPIVQQKRNGWAALLSKGSAKKNIIAQATQKQAAKTKAAQLANIVSMDAGFIPPRYSTDIIKPPKYVILHYGTRKTIWDWTILIMTLYTAVAVPFAVSFHYVSLFMSIFDTMVDIIFITDIVCNFRTTYVDKDGNMVLQPKLIRGNYLRRWFAIDLLAAVPYSLVTFFTPDGIIAELFAVVKVIRLMRLSRVARKLDYYLQFGATTLVLWVCAFCLCAHWMACVWYVIGYYYDTPSKKWGWLYQLSVITQQPYQYINGTIVQHSGPTVASLYMSALYYTMSSLTTCGFGNIAPSTTAEKFFGCITMLLGCVLYAFIFGQVTSIIQQLQRQSSIFHQTISNMKRFIKIYKIPRGLAMRIIDYYVSTWAINKGVDIEAILKECPRELQADVCVHIHRPIFDNLDVFTEAPASTLSAIARHFWKMRTGPGDRIIQNGESLEVLYFIAKGSLEIKLRGEIYGMLGTLDAFGSITDTEYEQAIYDVYAMTYCDLHCVKKVDLHDALAGYPDYYDKFLSTFTTTFNLGKAREIVTSQSMLSVRERSRKKSAATFSKLLPFTSRLDAVIDDETSIDHIRDGGREYGEDATKSNDGNESPNLEVLSGLNELKGEVRIEIARINSKMGLVEEQITQILKLLQTKLGSDDIKGKLEKRLKKISNFEQDTSIESESEASGDTVTLDTTATTTTKGKITFNKDETNDGETSEDLPFWLAK